MNIRVITTEDSGTWNEYVTHPVQSYEWGVIKESLGTPIVRFGVYEEDILQDVFLMTLHPIPYTKFKIGYIARSKMPNDDVCTYLDIYAKKENIICIKWEPNVIYSNQPLPRLCVQSKHHIFFEWTRCIDLTKTIDTLKKELDGTTRYNIGLADRKGVVVSIEDTDQGFEDFYSVYNETVSRKKFGGHTKTYHQKVWNILKEKGIAHILIARYGGIPIAVSEIFIFKNVLYSTYGASSSMHRNVKAMNALIWKVIMFGKEHGATMHDLWGIAPPNEHDVHNPWYGFSDFKKGFGGYVVQMYPSFDQVIFPRLYVLYSLLFDIRKKVLRFIQK